MNMQQPLYYSVDALDWGIDDKGSNAIETTEGINRALKYASSKSFYKVHIPKGTYLIDAVNTSRRLPEFGGGINIPSNIELILHPEAVFKVLPNDSQGYSCFYIGQASNVTIRGGQIIGDRYEHDYSKVTSIKRTHEWGYGIHIHGSSNVLIENVQVSDCIGDNIWIAADGMMNTSGAYTPSKNVTVRKCTLLRGRRNNLATNGCEGLLVDDCDIEEAGGDTIGPQLGIDLEGFGENGIKYDHPYKLTVRNCRFKNNGRGSVTAHTSGEVNLEGNYSDNVISYGFSTDVSIKNNKIINDAEVKKYGIDSVGVSSTESGNRVQIEGNTVRGFEVGICARGKGVSISNNTLEGIKACPIATHQAEDVLITDNRIENSDCIQVQVRNSNDVRVVNNKGKGTISAYAVKIMDSTRISLINNEFVNVYGGIYCERSQSVRLKGNDLLLSGIGYGIFWDKDSSVSLQRNEIHEPRNVAIKGTPEKYSCQISENQIYFCKALIAIQLTGGSEHMLKDNEIMFNRSTDQGYGVYLENTDKVRLVRNDARGIGGKLLSHPYCTDKAKNTTLIHNTYDSGTLKTAEGDIVV
ncbi:right-handed parallel beta-helix repeat-containing protein [Bacillus velezensis]|uniref:right-handed parallel beta-helix repeat-containing protein n=1 Tax=Bacillus velezensis TaxID=492670 RepID=UPI0004587B12|nr:right-handed parallel beta-helix repeat-containing protein [Bacillus velezensis]AHZ16084.1 SPBc2 prophage-derived protein YorA [Bacillus velezensis SQR9]AZJ44217.1 right-handed parallel beta-helix repeat-containing protein [Bacillus velezensis]MDH2300110.1 right-handed parallel beta-helix repeat-containing protein [Bacillus velezensis]MDR4960819.1 right-handed parallel beta-helix repeat-containing protein [Bacillus velezensis]MEC2162802.1 right-handed parallel beta-helix repeat-containing p